MVVQGAETGTAVLSEDIRTTPLPEASCRALTHWWSETVLQRGMQAEKALRQMRAPRFASATGRQNAGYAGHALLLTMCATRNP